MPVPPIDLFLFDLAGTTVRDDGMVANAFKTTASNAGITVDDEWCRHRMGLYKLEVFREMIAMSGRTDLDPASLTVVFDNAIEMDVRTRGVELLAGTADAIRLLTGQGIRVGFTTGFTKKVAICVVEGAGMPTDIVVGSDEVKQGRPAPDLIQEGMKRAGVTDPKRVGVAGDTPSDLGAGDAAGCAHVIGVGHGTHTLDELSRHPHTALLPDLGGLPTCLGLVETCS